MGDSSARWTVVVGLAMAGAVVVVAGLALWKPNLTSLKTSHDPKGKVVVEALFGSRPLVEILDDSWKSNQVVTQRLLEGWNGFLHDSNFGGLADGLRLRHPDRWSEILELGRQLRAKAKPVVIPVTIKFHHFPDAPDQRRLRFARGMKELAGRIGAECVLDLVDAPQISGEFTVEDSRLFPGEQDVQISEAAFVELVAKMRRWNSRALTDQQRVDAKAVGKLQGKLRL